MNKLSIRDLDLAGKRVFIRVDFNVPLDGSHVTDDTRIRETLPTLRLAIERGARLVLASHLGRPKGKVNPKYSLAPGRRAAEGTCSASRSNSPPIAWAPKPKRKAKRSNNGDVLLLENVRFHAEEEANDAAFSKQLAALCDGLFVCDAFGSAHRAHASVVGITQFVRQSAAGLLMEKELAYLGQGHFESRAAVRRRAGRRESFRQDRGGAEPDEARRRHADRRRHGVHISEIAGPADREVARRKRQARSRARRCSTKPASAISGCSCPVDHVLAESPDSTATKIADIAATPEGWMGLDIGPKSIELFSQEISKARTIVWNGPLGMFERPAFSQGTLAIARAVAAATAKGATSIIGGGDSVAAAEQSGVARQISHISTGGGASLEFLAGEKLPGVEALTNK